MDESRSTATTVLIALLAVTAMGIGSGASIGAGTGTGAGTGIGAGTGAAVGNAAGPVGPAATNLVSAQQDGACSFPVTVTDASGTEVSLQEEPERIVVLAPSDAQTLWAIGARERVVGMPVDQFTSYLNGTEGKTDVTNDDGSVNVEQVVGLQPDVVFAASVTPNQTVSQLRQAGITVYQTALATSIEDVYGVTERYGRLTGACAGANETVEEMRTRVSEIESAANGSDVEEPPVLYYFYNFTAGTGTHIDDVVQTAGARNIAVQAGISGYQQVNAEIVASRNPEWIVHPSGAPIPQGQPYSGTTALQENRTVTLEANLIQQPGPRIVYPLTTLARALHPEAMNETDLTPVDFSASSASEANANATGAAGATGTATESPIVADGGNATVTETTAAATTTTATVSDTGGSGAATTTNGGATTTTGETEAGTDTGTGASDATTGTSGPGFGLVAGVVALLAVALLVRYRN